MHPTSIHDFPTEILLMIFRFAVAAMDYIGPRNAPWSLSQVSRNWRAIALTAELWASFNLDAEDMGSHAIALMTMWLERSGERPLDVVLSVIDEPMSDEDTTGPFLVLLAKHFHRCRSITLACCGVDLSAMTDALENHNGNAPLLEDLSITTYIDDDNEDDDSLIEDQIHHILQQAPRLQSFFWKDRIILRDTFDTWQHLTLPGSQLRKLQLICNLSTEEIVGVISQCPILEIFIVNVNITSSDVCIQPAHLVHTSLCYLTITLEGAEMHLFDFLTLPSLRELRLKNTTTCAHRFLHPVFAPFLERSHCPLEVLELSMRLDVSEAVIVDTLQSLPSLRYLKLYHYAKEVKSYCVGRAMIELLCSVMDGYESWSLCPNLRGFTFLDVIGPVAPTWLPRMIEVRLQGFNRGVREDSGMGGVRIRVNKTHLEPSDIAKLAQLQSSLPADVLRVSFRGEDDEDSDDDEGKYLADVMYVFASLCDCSVLTFDPYLRRISRLIPMVE